MIENYLLKITYENNHQVVYQLTTDKITLFDYDSEFNFEALEFGLLAYKVISTKDIKRILLFKNNELIEEYQIKYLKIDTYNTVQEYLMPKRKVLDYTITYIFMQPDRRN